MKNKFLNLLFLLCSLVLFLGTVSAEEDDSGRYDFSIFEPDKTGEKAENAPDYSSACKKYTNKDERINCCNQDTSASGRYECKKSLYDVCMNGSGTLQRMKCCSQNFSGEELENCNDAAQNYCGVNELVKLQKAAAAVDVKYEPVVLKADGYDDPNSTNYSVLIYALDIKVYNITKDIRVIVQPEGGTPYTLDVSNNTADGYVVLRDDNVGTIKNYSFAIYSRTGSCENGSIRNIKLSTPRYNHLSNREACREVPGFYKCQEFVSYDFETGDYVKEIQEYKEKLAKQGIKEKEDGTVASKGGITKAIKKVSDNKWVVLAIVLVVGCVVTYFLIKKRRED